MTFVHDETRNREAVWYVLDLDDNRYLVPDVEALPEREQELFLRYVNW